MEKNLYNYTFLKNSIVDYVKNEKDFCENIQTGIGAIFCNYYENYFADLDFLFVKNEINILYVLWLSDIFLYVCALFDVVPSDSAFCELCGFDLQDFKRWNLKQYDIDVYTWLTRIVKSKDFDMETYAGLLARFGLHSDIDNITLNNSIVYIYRDLLKGEKITVIKAGIFKKLQDARENAIKNRLISNNNAVGLLGVANNEYLWDVKQTAQETRARALALQDLPKIGNVMLTQSDNAHDLLTAESL